MNMTASITVQHGETVADLKESLAAVPDDATYSVQTHKGDRNYSDYHTITFSWSV